VEHTACSVAWPVGICGMQCSWCAIGLGFHRPHALRVA